MKKKSKEIALAGMLSALAVVILFLGSMIELLDLSAAALAALVVMVAVIDLGNGKAVAVYLVSAILSVLIHWEIKNEKKLEEKEQEQLQGEAEEK